MRYLICAFKQIFPITKPSICAAQVVMEKILLIFQHCPLLLLSERGESCKAW